MSRGAADLEEVSVEVVLSWLSVSEGVADTPEKGHLAGATEEDVWAEEKGHFEGASGAFYSV